VSGFDYVTVGHVTVDVVGPSGERRPGGGAFYSALQAARLGMRTQIVTQGRRRELEELLEPYRDEFELRVLPAERTTTLATSGMGAERRQRVLAWAGPMREPIEVDAAILHLAAVARETPTDWQGRAEFVGVTPQGLMRAWEADDRGQVSLVALDPRDLPAQVDALVVSRRERPYCELLPTRPVIAVTAGRDPTMVIVPDGTAATAAVPPVERVRDDLGAGDVFAAAFFIALHGGDAPLQAAAWGNAAAAVRVSGVGAGAVGAAVAIARVRRR